MTNYRKILRLFSLRITKMDVAASCGCSRNTVTNVLQRAAACRIGWPLSNEMTNKELAEKLFPSGETNPTYKMPDYEYIHREMAKSSVTLSLLTNYHSHVPEQRYAIDLVMLGQNELMPLDSCIIQKQAVSDEGIGSDESLDLYNALDILEE